MRRRLQRRIAARSRRAAALFSVLSSIEAQASECTAILSEAMPALAEARSALNIITKNDLTEIKNLKNPPMGVRVTLEAI